MSSKFPSRDQLLSELARSSLGFLGAFCLPRYVAFPGVVILVQLIIQNLLRRELQVNPTSPGNLYVYAERTSMLETELPLMIWILQEGDQL